MQEKIQELEYNLDNIKSDLQSNEILKLNSMNELSLRETEFDQY
jgi:hypothetical protein